MDKTGAALVELGRILQGRGYRFVTVTPTTHERVLARGGEAADLEDVFGWNLPFTRDLLGEAMMTLLSEAGGLAEENGRFRARLRFATAGDRLFAHSGFPTQGEESVFFGPDTYRFLRLLDRAMSDLKAAGPLLLVDIGCGSGAGGLHAAGLLAPGSDIVLADINPVALQFAAANAALAGVAARTVLSDVLSGVEGAPDIVIANPPYLVDDEKRLYRHGGGALGTALAERIVVEALDRLKPGGRLILYTGTPIVRGRDPFFQSVQGVLKLRGAQFRYEEIDPDVFGEELEKPAYRQADRIAAVGLIAIKNEDNARDA
jgi:SAM-dependent methyltransferase